MLHICVKLEHAYIRNVNVRWTHTHTQTDRQTDTIMWGSPQSATGTSDMQGMLWGEPELSHVCVFDHMVFFHSHNVEV